MLVPSRQAHSGEKLIMSASASWGQPPRPAAIRTRGMQGGKPKSAARGSAGPRPSRLSPACRGLAKVRPRAPRAATPRPTNSVLGLGAASSSRGRWAARAGALDPPEPRDAARRAPISPARGAASRSRWRTAAPHPSSLR